MDVSAFSQQVTLATTSEFRQTVQQTPAKRQPTCFLALDRFNTNDILKCLDVICEGEVNRSLCKDLGWGILNIHN